MKYSEEVAQVKQEVNEKVKNVQAAVKKEVKDEVEYAEGFTQVKQEVKEENENKV